jgi:hypothetical protein
MEIRKIASDKLHWKVEEPFRMLVHLTMWVTCMHFMYYTPPLRGSRPCLLRSSLLPALNAYATSYYRTIRPSKTFDPIISDWSSTRVLHAVRKPIKAAKKVDKKVD